MDRGELLAVCLLFWSCAVCVVSAIQRADLFPYGSLSGDLILAEGDDETSRVLSLPRPFYFYDSPFSQLYVSTALLTLFYTRISGGYSFSRVNILHVVFASWWTGLLIRSQAYKMSNCQVISLFERRQITSSVEWLLIMQHVSPLSIWMMFNIKKTKKQT